MQGIRLMILPAHLISTNIHEHLQAHLTHREVQYQHYMYFFVVIGSHMVLALNAAAINS